MCGICGIVQVDGTPRQVISGEALRAMTDVMTHRGPDDRGLHLADGIALGVRRLSIVDVKGGHQPFTNETSTIWAIQNGELYNHSAIRLQLKHEGHKFRSNCDTEVLPHLYERDGTAFATNLRGMFAVAVWDHRRRRAVLVRDRLGIKPLYYARRDDLLVFGSELKSILASGLIDPELDYEAIDAYLMLGFVPGPRTPLAGVSKLTPGHRLVIEHGTVRDEQFWRYPEPVVGTRRSEQEYKELLLAKLDESVQMQLMSDVPYGAMLSGGLDSSLIVALMAKHVSEPVRTFSVGFAEAGPQNELADARRVAKFFGTDHHELELSFKDTVDFEELVWHLDEPLADLSSVGFRALCELASHHVSVALSGQGADELFGGYRKHRAASIAGQWHRMPEPAKAVGAALAAHAPSRFRRAADTLRAENSVDRLMSMSGQMTPEFRRKLARGPLAELDGRAAWRAAEACLNGGSDDPLPATLFLDAQLGLVDGMLHYFDRASMAHSLEVRVPFLEHELVECVAQVPGALKVRGRTTKYILREMARDLIPNQVIDKPKIGFFNRAVSDWFTAQADSSISAYLLQPKPHYAEMLDAVQVRKLASSTGIRAADSRLLLAIFMLEVWLSSFVPRAMKVAARPNLAVQIPA